MHGEIINEGFGWVWLIKSLSGVVVASSPRPFATRDEAFKAFKKYSISQGMVDLPLTISDVSTGDML